MVFTKNEILMLKHLKKMLTSKCEIVAQRHQDSLFFIKSKTCTQAHAILHEDCIHLSSKDTIIFLSEEDVEKLEALKPLINNCTLEQLNNISKAFNKPQTSVLEWLNGKFNKKIGWFFINGMKK